MNPVSKRVLVFMVINWLFFGGVLVGSLLGQYGFSTYYVGPLGEEGFVREMNVSPWLVLEIFVSNLIFSGFVLLTLSGFFFLVCQSCFFC